LTKTIKILVQEDDIVRHL